MVSRMEPVARVAVKNRTLLRQMGFLERTRGEGAEEETPPPQGSSPVNE